MNAAEQLSLVPWQLWVVIGFFALAFLAQPFVYAWCEYTLRKVERREAERSEERPCPTCGLYMCVKHRGTSHE